MITDEQLHRICVKPELPEGHLGTLPDTYQWAGAQKNTTDEGDAKTSLRGFTKDGRRVYETDFTEDELKELMMLAK